MIGAGLAHRHTRAERDTQGVPEDEEEDEEEDIIYYKNDILDIEKHVLMEVLSSLPMKTLCKEDCKGLCPLCGTDFNKESCDCIVENIDPRFAKLKNFFDKN